MNKQAAGTANAGIFGKPQRLAARLWRGITWRTIRRAPLFSVIILTLLLVTGVFAPLLAPHSPTAGALAGRNLPPAWLNGGSATHLLGTDQLGRDILSRIIYGARISLTLGLVSLIAGAVVGTFLGMVAGYFGRWVDEVIMRLVDLQLAFPIILIALSLVAIEGQSFGLLVLVIALWLWAPFARMTRGKVLKLKTMEYVSLARISGCSDFHILRRHILPGLTSTLIVLATLQVGFVILLEAILSFLGLGVPPPTPAWGSMVADGRARIADAWWVSFFPGLAIFVVVMAFNLLGDWMRDHLDPRLRQQL